MMLGKWKKQPFTTELMCLSEHRAGSKKKKKFQGFLHDCAFQALGALGTSGKNQNESFFSLKSKTKNLEILCFLNFSFKK